MDLSFVTPELFNTLIVANLLVGVLLVGWRFSRDMRRSLPPVPASQPTDDTQPTSLLRQP